MSFNVPRYLRFIIVLVSHEYVVINKNTKTHRETDETPDRAQVFCLVES